MEQMKPSQPSQEKKSSLDVKLEQLVDMQIEMLKSQHQFENEMRNSLTNQAAQLRNLKVQMGQMASLLNERQQGILLSTLEVNPMREGIDHCKAITLRSGKELAGLREANEEDIEAGQSSRPEITKKPTEKKKERIEV